MTLAQLKTVTSATVDRYSRVGQALDAGTRWEAAHRIALKPQSVYVVRRVFCDGTVSDPVAAEWTMHLTWVEIIGTIPNEQTKGLEVWVP